MDSCIETIIGVYIVAQNGKRYTLPKPNRHHNCIHLAYEELGESIRCEDQGFITDKDRYVGREEALAIAKKANQLFTRHFHQTLLFSESVW